MGTDLTADSMDTQRQLDAAKAAEKEAEKPKGAEQPAALQGVADAQAARMETAEAVARGQESKTRNVDADLKALMTEFGLSDTGDAKHNFFQVAEKLAHEVEAKFGVPWQVCLAQSCLESGYGRSGLTQKAFNCFGFKTGGSDYKGDKITLPTREEKKDGTSYTIDADFRAYSSIRDSFYDYGRLLNTDRYKPAFEFVKAPTLFLAKVIECGYATDKRYVEKAVEIGKEYGMKVLESVTTAVSGKDSDKSDDKDKEEPGFVSQAIGYIKSVFGQMKDAFVQLLGALGIHIGKKKEDKAADSSELSSDWKEKVETPDAPVFSFGKGVAGVVTSPFGEREDPTKPGVIENHRGVDIGVPDGTQVFATQEAKIIDSPDSDNGAFSTTFETADGVQFTFHHLQERGKPAGTVVKAGEVLGVTGEKGKSTGPHLHVQAKVEGKFVDPKPYLYEGFRAPEEKLMAYNQAHVADMRGGSRLA